MGTLTLYTALLKSVLERNIQGKYLGFANKFGKLGKKLEMR